MKSALLTFGLLLLSSSILSQENYCKFGFCRTCGLAPSATGGDKSCNKCANGIQTLVSGKTLIYECKENNTIPNCKRTYSNLPSGTVKCGECNRDFVKVAEACVAVTTKIANCLFYENVTQCSLCTTGYFVDANKVACTKVAVEIPNCDIYMNLGTTKCAICMKGYRTDTNNLTCVAETTLIGCDERTGTFCNECREFFWATNYSTAGGQTCEYSSSLLKVLSVVSLAIMSCFAY